MRSLLGSALDPPSSAAVAETRHRLAAQKFIALVSDPDDGGDGGDGETLTALGDTLAALPLPPAVSRALVLGVLLRAAEPALSVAAALSTPEALRLDLHSPTVRQGRGVGRRGMASRKGEGVGCRSDVLVVVEAYEEWLATQQRLRAPSPSPPPTLSASHGAAVGAATDGPHRSEARECSSWGAAARI
jgi:HrpA-like RNA helicase